MVCSEMMDSRVKQQEHRDYIYFSPAPVAYGTPRLTLRGLVIYLRPKWLQNGLDCRELTRIFPIRESPW